MNTRTTQATFCTSYQGKGVLNVCDLCEWNVDNRGSHFSLTSPPSSVTARSQYVRHPQPWPNKCKLVAHVRMTAVYGGVLLDLSPSPTFFCTRSQFAFVLKSFKMNFFLYPRICLVYNRTPTHLHSNFSLWKSHEWRLCFLGRRRRKASALTEQIFW
jgi:hypothetical protein